MSKFRASALFSSMALGVLACSDPSGPQLPPVLTVTVESPPPESAPPGAALSPIILRVTDADGDPAVGLQLTAEVDGTISPAAPVTDANGRVSIQWTLPRDPQAASENPLGLTGDHVLTIRSEASDVEQRFEVRANAFQADQFDASSDYACGINQAGLWCWGQPGNRILETAAYSPPTRPTLPTGVAAAEVRVNWTAACIRAASDGKPWCATRHAGPAGFRAVPNAPALIEIVDAGKEFCGRTSGGSTVCWDVENGTISPADVLGDHQFVALAGQSNGSNTGIGCGLKTAGEVWCWGDNNLGQFGHLQSSGSDTPVQIALPEPMVAIRAGSSGACGYTASGEAWCWGAWFDRPPLADVAPRTITSAGAFGTEVFPGSVELYRLRADGVTATWDGQQWEPFPELRTHLQIVEIVDEGQACARGLTGEIYCSWIILGGGGDSQLSTGTLRPVPAL